MMASPRPKGNNVEIGDTPLKEKDLRCYDMVIKIIRNPESQACWLRLWGPLYGYVVFFFLANVTHISLVSLFECCAIISRAELLFNSQAQIQKQKQRSQSNLNRLIDKTDAVSLLRLECSPPKLIQE